MYHMTGERVALSKVVLDSVRLEHDIHTLYGLRATD